MLCFFTKILSQNNMTKNKLGLTKHPCIYPTPMIERIVKMTTDVNDVVLDPFLGSGTTLVAAENLYPVTWKNTTYGQNSNFRYRPRSGGFTNTATLHQ